MMNDVQDGPKSPLFQTLALQGNASLSRPDSLGLPESMLAALTHAPAGDCVGWGIPFQVDEVVAIRDKPVHVELDRVAAGWLVFMHTSDLRPHTWTTDGFISPMRGEGYLGEHVADYVILYADWTEEWAPVRRRHEIGAFQRRWGENCVGCAPYRKPYPLHASDSQAQDGWGRSQTRMEFPDQERWMN